MDNYNMYYSSSVSSIEEDYHIDYIYKSGSQTISKKIDEIDELLKLYEEYPYKKKSIWKKILFLFSKNRK